MSRRFTLEEVSQHNTEEDCWIVLYGKVIHAEVYAILERLNETGGPGVQYHAVC